MSDDHLNPCAIKSVVAALLLCACGVEVNPGEGDRRVRVIAPMEIAALRVEGGVVSACEGVEGRHFDTAVEQTLPLSTAESIGLPRLDQDSGVVARVINNACEVVAFGCVSVAESEQGDLEVVVEAREPYSSCALSERCERGTCRPIPAEDAGPPLPDGVTRSPDGEGYCFPLQGYTCDCTGLLYYCEMLDCWAGESNRTSICDAHPSQFVEIIDEHGCPGFELRDTGEVCNPPPE